MLYQTNPLRKPLHVCYFLVCHTREQGHLYVLSIISCHVFTFSFIVVNDVSWFLKIHKIEEKEAEKFARKQQQYSLIDDDDADDAGGELPPPIAVEVKEGKKHTRRKRLEEDDNDDGVFVWGFQFERHIYPNFACSGSRFAAEKRTEEERKRR